MPALQEIIHKVEVAGGVRYVRYVLGTLVAVFVIVGYNLRVARNMSTQEAMDSAQLARNISQGKGYTTSFVRPFSIYLVGKKNQEKLGLPDTSTLADYGRLKTAHPDISNPPVYPVVLAGLMKILPFRYEMSRTLAFLSENGRPVRHQPDFMIGWFNQLLFLGVIVLTFLWARRLFDTGIAAMTAVLLFGSEMLWRFSASGLSTMLLMLIFMAIVWGVTVIEQRVADPNHDPLRVLVLSAAVGVLVGIGALTRYGFALMIVPTVVFLVLFSGARRVVLALACFFAFAAVLTPWIIRNYSVSGAPFGTASYAVLYGASAFSEYRLERSLDPNVHFLVRPILLKLLVNSRQLFQGDFFTIAGGWVTTLFLAGLLLSFRNPTIRRMRYFAVGGLGMMFLVQALGRTHLSEDSAAINSENYLVLMTPLVVVYATAFFFALVDQIEFAAVQLRWLAVAVFAGLACLPMIFALLPPKGSPIAYPPYYFPAIQQASGLLRTNELMMSDIPWAVAWYGDRQCVWLTLNAMNNPEDASERENFFTINDFQKPINALYLTPKTLDLPFAPEMIRAGPAGWGTFILNTLLRHEPPKTFPLRELAPEFLPEQLLLTDWKRALKVPAN